jgi:phage protein D
MSNANTLPYFAPAFRIKVGGQPLEPAQEKTVAELSVTHEPGTTDHFSIVLTSPYPELPWTHGKDAALFKPGVGVAIEMGYVDDTQLMISGEVTGLTPSFPSDGASTLRVDGHSRLHRLDGPRRTRTFQDVTDSEIADQVAQQAGLSSNSDATQLRYPYVIQNNQTDLEFLRERADGIDFELLVEDRTLVFRKSKAGAAKSISLKWGESLRRFQPTLNSLRPLTEVTVRGYDPKAKKEIVGRAAAGAEETTMGEQSGAELVNAAFGSRSEMVVDRQPMSQAEAEARAKAVFNQRMMELITGNGESIGHPALRAGAVVEITGLGSNFSGLYYVVRSTHSIGSSGYETRFSVRKNAVS